MRKTLLTIAAAACIAGGLTISAEAMPLSAPPTTAPANAAHLILVRQGCGGGFHRNGFGRCVPNMRVRRYYRRHYWRPYRHCYTRRTYYGFRRVCRVY